VCLNRARTDLCGGRAAMRVPTAKIQERFCRGPLELSPLPSQCVPPVAPQFRLQPRQPVSLAAAFVDALRTNRNPAHAVVQDRCAYPRNGSLHPHSPRQRLAFSESLPNRLQLLVDYLAPFENTFSEGPAELSRKTLRKVTTTATQTHRKADYRARSFPLSSMRFPRYDSRL
jgi:hypothetical protein